MTTTPTTKAPNDDTDNDNSSVVVDIPMSTRVMLLCRHIKAICSMGILVFSIVLVIGLIFTKQTYVSYHYHPIVACVMILLSLILLSMVEGSQASFVGLTPIQPNIYQSTHPISYKLCTWIYTGDNFHRFLLGRQFLVVVLVYIINICGAPIMTLPTTTTTTTTANSNSTESSENHHHIELWGLSDFTITFFLVSGIAMILFTSIIAQLPSQVIASHCMLDYINNHLATMIVYITLFIEFTGILHASYICSFIIHHFANRVVETNEPPKTGLIYYFFWFRCCLSCTLLVYSLAVTIKALYDSKTTLWWDDSTIPPIITIALFLILLSIVGTLEGMQIAYFASAKLRPEDRGTTYLAQKTSQLLFQGNGYNLPSFMIGRQLFVVANFFIIAHITTIDITTTNTSTTDDVNDGTNNESFNNNIFQVSDFVQSIFNTGLLGALITTIIGSIAWQLLASAFPVAFLSSPITYILLRISLWLEGSGIMSASWILASIIQYCTGTQRDEVYIGTAEDRIEKNMGDDGTDHNLHLGAGHIVKLPGFNVDHAPQALKDLMLQKNPSTAATYNESLPVILEEENDDDNDIQLSPA